MPRIKFRYRISLLVLLAAISLLIVIGVTLVVGRKNEQQLTGIETRYVPLIELDGELKRSYADIARTLEDAAGAGETSKIDEADRMSSALRARIRQGAQVIIDNGGDPKALEDAFVAYYAVAREVSTALASGAQFGHLAERIEIMREAQREVTVALDAATRPNRAKLAAAFAAARESQRTSLRFDILVAGIALALMTLLSWRIIRRTVQSLHAVSAGVERLASGDFSRSIDVPGGDEFGDLAREANRTAERLRAYREQSEREAWIKSGVAELSERIAGELSVQALAQRALAQLSAYVEAGTSTIHVADERGQFAVLASRGIDEGALVSTFHRDEKAHAASLARETIVQLSDDRRLLRVTPWELAVPLRHEGRVMGLMVLGVTEQPPEKTLELLRRAEGILGVALRVAESRERTTSLLVETQRQARAAETANQELEAFSYSVSHDLRAPLRGIDGFSQALVEDEGDKLSADGQKYLQRIRAGAQRMAELIDDMLRLSRVSRGDFRRDRVDISAIAETVVSELRRAHPDRTIDVHIEPGIKAYADARLARIALENLFGNAWKFTAKTDDARIEFGAQTVADEVVYFVRDNGAGFDMKYADRLFGAFQRLHTDKDYSGTGIGLATVQRIVLRHGGRIWAEAAVGQGATFKFTLPEEVAGTSRRSTIPP